MDAFLTLLAQIMPKLREFLLVVENVFQRNCLFLLFSVFFILDVLIVGPFDFLEFSVYLFFVRQAKLDARSVLSELLVCCF